MSVSVNPPKTPVTEGSSGIAIATLPNICKMPGPPAPFVPAPLPNIGKSGDSSKGYSKKVKIKGKKVAISGASFKSMGDMASKGTGGGIISSNTHGPCKFISPGSMDVKFEGKNVHLLTDMVTNNGGPSGSPPNSATMMGVLQTSGLFVLVEKIDKCAICHKEHKELAESGTTKNRALDLSEEYHDQVVAWRRVDADVRDATMLGVLMCQCKKVEYADNSGGTVHQLIWSADKLGMKHREPCTTGENKNRLYQFVQKRHGQGKAKSTWRRISRERKEEISSNRNSYNGIGVCAAPNLIMLCYEDNGYPGSITERFYKHEWPKPKDTLKRDRNRTGNEYVYKIVERDENGRRTVSTKKRTFKSGETVPPCGTCEILLPILICPEPGEAECTH